MTVTPLDVDKNGWNLVTKYNTMKPLSNQKSYKTNSFMYKLQSKSNV